MALGLKGGQEYVLRVEIATGMLKGHRRLALTVPEPGRFEVKAGLKPLDEGKVMKKSRVSVEGAKFHSPLPAQTQTTTKIQPPAQSLPDDPPVHVVVLSDAPTETDPESSLGEAARKVRQQKQATINSAVSNPQ